MHIRCPHCHNPIELVQDAELCDVTCPSCGSQFSLVGEETLISPDQTDPTFGHFSLIEQVGAGAFGSVWKARDTQLDRVVAVKIPRKGQLDGAEAEQFLREARAAAQLKHSNIVSVHEVGREDELLYIVSDFVEGLTLASWLSGQEPTFREAAQLCVTIAEALHHAHEAGVIHRDLKPGNIMLDAEGSPHIMDFGLAKREAGEITITVDGQRLGTPAYMPPEQASGDSHHADRRSDVYSLGVILFELLTGERPFRGDVRMLLHQVIHEEVGSPRKLRAGLPRDLETICLKCLRKEPDRRYETAQEVADDLRRWLHGEPIQARPVSRVEKAWLWCRRRPTICGSAAAILLTACIATGLILHARQQNLISRIDTAIQAMGPSRSVAVPLRIEALTADGFRHGLVLRKLQTEFSRAEEPGKLGLAYALAHFGDVRWRYLVEQIRGSAATEATNLIEALRHGHVEGRKNIKSALREREATSDLQYKSRLAIVALFLGDQTPASGMCQLRPDPVERTVFIKTLASWHGDLAELSEVVVSLTDSAMCSAVCLAIGSVSPETRGATAAWESIFADWYQHRADSGTHSAAGYALRKWGLELPQIERTPEPAEGIGWHVNPLGITMLRIPAGRFVREATFTAPDDRRGEQDQTVVLTRDFLLSDREISIALFRKFVEDPGYPKEEKPDNWEGEYAFKDATGEHPVQTITWFDAVLFCNWLSMRCGLEPCYKRKGRDEKVGFTGEEGLLELDEKANGYRLPTEAEWEYACRAGTTTTYAMGDDEASLADYCTYALNSSRSTSKTGQRLSNGWGLFDMHGNVWEWCQDWHETYGSRPVVEDPLGTEHTGFNSRMYRGGSWKVLAEDCRPSLRNGDPPRLASSYLGFRVASVPSGQ